MRNQILNAVENPRTQRKHTYTHTFNLGRNGWQYPQREYFQHSSESKKQGDYQRYMEWLEEKLRAVCQFTFRQNKQKMSKGI